MSEKLHSRDPRALYHRWAEGAGPFALFVRKANFMSLRHYPDIDLIEPSQGLDVADAVMHILSAADIELRRDLILLDVPGISGLAASWRLQNQMDIKPVLVYPNLLHPNGAVGGDELVRALVWCGEKLSELKEPHGFALVLDCDRYLADGELPASYYNNQYELGEDDLPRVEMLKSLGMERVMLIRSRPKEDVDSYLNYLCEKGILVSEYMISVQGGD
ncbi:MAG: hypothetical protein ACM3PP_05100 [Candidatus Saccharibacteria bacterium]